MREQQGLDLDALENEAIALAEKEPGDRGFLRGLKRYAAGILDGHANVELDGISLQEKRQWPFTLVEVREGVMIDGIGPATFRSKALARGDLILAINDQPIDDVLAAQEKFVIASTSGARRRKAIYELTESTEQESLRVRAVPMGQTDPVNVEVPCPLLSEPVPRYSWRHFKTTYHDLDDETAYFCVGDFSPRDGAFTTAEPADRNRILAPQYDEFARTFEKAASKTRLVLDLRGNPGGTDLLGQALALHLMEPGFRYYGLVSEREGRWRTKASWYTPAVGRGLPRFRGRIACLIDEHTFSVADNFAACLRDEHPDVVFVGRPTGGGSGAPRTFTLPSTKARVTFCTMRVYAPNGTFVEGNGVVPDIAVRATRAELRAGTDAVLAAAVAALKR